VPPVDKYARHFRYIFLPKCAAASGENYRSFSLSSTLMWFFSLGLSEKLRLKMLSVQVRVILDSLFLCTRSIVDSESCFHCTGRFSRYRPQTIFYKKIHM
jgi:hypothetical protein